MSREYHFFIKDIVQSCEKIIRYIEKLSFEQFCADEVIPDGGSNWLFGPHQSPGVEVKKKQVNIRNMNLFFLIQPRERSCGPKRQFEPPSGINMMP